MQTLSALFPDVPPRMLSAALKAALGDVDSAANALLDRFSRSTEVAVKNVRGAVAVPLAELLQRKNGVLEVDQRYLRQYRGTEVKQRGLPSMNMSTKGHDQNNRVTEGQFFDVSASHALTLDLTSPTTTPLLGPLIVRPLPSAATNYLTERGNINLGWLTHEWQHLPIELWFLIFSHLSDDPQSLVRFAGVSRGLRACVQLAGNLRLAWTSFWGTTDDFDILLPLFVNDPIFLLAASLGRRVRCDTCRGVVLVYSHAHWHQTVGVPSREPLKLMVTRKAPKRIGELRCLLDRNKVAHTISLERLSTGRVFMEDPNVGLRIFSGISDILLYVRCFYRTTAMM